MGILTSSYTINVRGRLFDLSKPQVMGILNLTPDSFYAASRMQTEEAAKKRVRQILDEGGTMIDVGACSTRPDADMASANEEKTRLRVALKAVHEEAPDAVVSVDTFRADVAKMAVEELGADIINDISGGKMDSEMFPTVARLGVPYVLTHLTGTLPLHAMEQGARSDGEENVTKTVMLYFSERVQRLRDLGQKDIILDPGYGFGKTLDQNYELLANQHMLQVFELPLLVGVSRKSMIFRLLGTTPDEALNGTTVLNTIALKHGASILRVHDVKEAVEAVKLTNRLISTVNPQLKCSTLA